MYADEEKIDDALFIVLVPAEFNKKKFVFLILSYKSCQLKQLIQKSKKSSRLNQILESI